MLKLIQGDCLEVMKDIPDGSIDLVLTDPPYGTTACKWDSVIPFEPMWEQLKRITKKNGAIVLTASQPFTSALVMSNVKMFKYCWVWKKNIASNFLQSGYMPLKRHEDVCVFYRKPPVYNKQKGVGTPYYQKRNGADDTGDCYGSINKRTTFKRTPTENKGYRNPISVLEFDRETGKHPTQKPVALMEYLIKTYTNESETVLDFTMGRGTTGVAAKSLNRGFIGIEMDETYFNIARERINGKD